MDVNGCSFPQSISKYGIHRARIGRQDPWSQAS